jgi:hypothetical protein
MDNKFTDNYDNNKIKVIGAVGYTILDNNKIKLMVIADMHDITEKCGDIFISDWIKQQKNFKLLLEEVPQTDIKLKELWSSSPHTTKLRKLYLDNYDKIVGLDIRGELLKFSWELLKDMQFPEITLDEYLKYLKLFFQIKHPFFLTNIPEIYNKSILLTKESKKIRKHFEYCKSKFDIFVNELNNKNLLNQKVQDIYKTNKKVLEEINLLLNEIMEFYTCMQLYKQCLLNNNKFIIHKGLFHTSNLLVWFTNLYGFKILDNSGLTEFDKINEFHNGCLDLPKNY